MCPTKVKQIIPGRQNGAIMLITLVTLLLLFLSTIALIRSLNGSLLLSGNLAFKRDLTNQAERGAAMAVEKFKTGNLSTETARTADVLGENYYASKLPENDQGVPLVLIKDSSFTGTASDIVDTTSGVTVRYVIDRQCNSAGAFDAGSCTGYFPDMGGSASASMKKLPTQQAVYRISVRATGPKGSQSFLQVTITH